MQAKPRLCLGPGARGARRNGRSHRTRSHRLAARVARTRVQEGGRAAGRGLGERRHRTGQRRDGGARAARGGRIREAWRDGCRCRTTGFRRTQGATRLPEPPDRGDVERAAGEPGTPSFATGTCSSARSSPCRRFRTITGRSPNAPCWWTARRGPTSNPTSGRVWSLRPICRAHVCRRGRPAKGSRSACRSSQHRVRLHESETAASGDNERLSRGVHEGHSYSLWKNDDGAVRTGIAESVTPLYWHRFPDAEAPEPSASGSVPTDVNLSGKASDFSTRFVVEFDPESYEPAIGVPEISYRLIPGPLNFPISSRGPISPIGLKWLKRKPRGNAG